MIGVINKDFFTMRRHTVTLKHSKTESNNFITLVNLYTDPKMAELNKYEKKAFMSFVFKSKENPEKYSESQIYDIMESSEINQLSMYTDSRYEEIKEIFPTDIRYPTIIFEATKEYTAKNLCLLALPIKGIVPVIKKSEMYKLYNGSLVVCKLFKYQSTHDAEVEFFNKLIYILVDIKTAFMFTEYITTKDEMFGVMKSYNFLLTPKDIKHDSENSNENFSVKISLKQERSLVPYLNRQEEFFTPTQKQPNIFKLSDIPSDIYVKHNSIIKELSSSK